MSKLNKKQIYLLVQFTQKLCDSNSWFTKQLCVEARTPEDLNDNN